MQEYFEKFYGADLAHELAGKVHEPSLTLKQIMNVLYRGRTMTNFSHVPGVTRAIDWLAQDFEKAMGR